MNFILVGMPGSGKSTIAEKLAVKLGLNLADTDKMISDSHGEISKIFKEYGEEYFRLLESRAIEEISRTENTVIATGGGCLQSGKNVKLLKSCGKIIYLKTGINELIDRLKGDSSRPLLAEDGALNLKRLFKVRAGSYEAAADLTVITDGRTPDEIVKEITEKIK